MSAMNPTPRRRRGRIVTVGEFRDLGDLSRTMVQADNLFDALGEIRVSSAGQPVDAVLMPARLVKGSAAMTVDAFRRVDPSVRLLLVASTDEELQQVEGGPNGFDAVLVQPLTAIGLEEALRDGEPAPATAAPSRREPPPPAPVIDVLPTATADEVAAPVDADDELGDTDLVEAILTDPGGLGGRALRLIAQQTGWSDLAVSDAPPTDDGVGCAEVRYGQRCYGILCSRQAAARQLHPWAQWLARWLALDQGYRDYRTMAFRDELTGAWNRRFYEVFMKRILKQASRTRRAVTVLVFDIDDFKRYNDDFGHDAGDEVLRETVRLLNSVIRSGDRVCRIGGDEFVVIFADLEQPRKPGSNPPETVEQIANRFQDQICKMNFPKLGLDAPGNLSISGGLATFPWDGTDADGLLRHADQLALQSKRKGKNVITIGPGLHQRRH